MCQYINLNSGDRRMSGTGAASASSEAPKHTDVVLRASHLPPFTRSPPLPPSTNEAKAKRQTLQTACCYAIIWKLTDLETFCCMIFETVGLNLPCAKLVYLQIVFYFCFCFWLTFKIPAFLYPHQDTCCSILFFHNNWCSVSCFPKVTKDEVQR